MGWVKHKLQVFEATHRYAEIHIIELEVTHSKIDNLYLEQTLK